MQIWLFGLFINDAHANSQFLNNWRQMLNTYIIWNPRTSIKIKTMRNLVDGPSQFHLSLGISW